ncbi:hypothetical protein AAVH_35671 [Aphelenchoides avenae]|nr:hypothetical protein AAVH_35671 [Aphelenchus avenae]
MPFVEALEWYVEANRARSSPATSDITGTRQSDRGLSAHPRGRLEHQPSQAADDLRQGADWADPLKNRSSVYVEDFRDHNIRMPELQDVGQSSFGVRDASNPLQMEYDARVGLSSGSVRSKTR